MADCTPRVVLAELSIRGGLAIIGRWTSLVVHICH